MKPYVWRNGLIPNFTFSGLSVTSTSLTGTITQKKQTLINYLNYHLEGIEVYDIHMPHAVLLTDYDSATDTFYCADPGYASGSYSAKRIQFAYALIPGSGQNQKLEPSSRSGMLNK